MTWTVIFDLDKLTKGQNFQNITGTENLPKYAWILCVRHNLLLAELCALRARCLWFQMLLIIVSTPSGSFKADRLYLFRNWSCKGILCHSFIQDFDVFSLYNFGSSSSLIKPSSHVLLSNSFSFIFRYCPRLNLSFLHCMMSVVHLHLILGAVLGTRLVLFRYFCPYCGVLSSSNQLCLHCTWLLVVSMNLWLSQYFQSWVLTSVLLSVSLCIPSWSSPSSPVVLFLHLLLSPSTYIQFHLCLWCYFHLAAVFLQSLLLCLTGCWQVHISLFQTPSWCHLRGWDSYYCLNQWIYLFGTSPKKLDVFYEYQVVISAASFLGLVPNLHSL